MTEAEKNQLVADSEQVRDETVNKANTATRVGTLFRNIVNFAYSIYGDIPEQSDQFNTDAEITYLSDVSRKYTTSQIDFTYNGHYGTTISPIYDSFTFSEASIIQGNKNKKAEMFLSADTVPSIISSPPLFLAGNITGTILTGYANLNKLEFELKMVYNETTDVFEPKVLLTITQGANANEDPESPSISDETLVIHYSFEESSSLDTIIDSSQYGHDASIVSTSGSTRVAGIQGNAIQINSNSGNSSFTRADTTELNMAGNTPFTIAFWSRLTEAGSLGQTCGIFQKGGFRVTKQPTSGITPPDSFDFRINGVSADRVRTGTVPFDTWVHTAFTFNGTTELKSYTNGILIDTATITSTEILDDATSLQVVGLGSNSLRSGNQLDELRVYKRLLDATEILDIYNNEGSEE
jgi:hypothetical protein